jgi:hypothetical protein
MKIVKNLKFVMLVICLLGGSRLACPAHNIQLYLVHAVDSPLEISDIRFVASADDYQAVIQNKTDREIERIVFKGIIFDVSNERIGGFLLNKSVALKARETTMLMLNLENIAKMPDKDSPALFKDFFQDKNAFIFIPFKIFFKQSIEEQHNNEINYYWTFNSRAIHSLSPFNLASFKQFSGGLLRNDEPYGERYYPCQFAEWCHEDSYATCGNPVIDGQCRTMHGCIHSFMINCSSLQCNFLCKPLDECC